MKYHAALLAALGLFAFSADAQPTAQVTIEAARAAARADRNREAADLFRQAIEASPEMRRELLADYADQLTYSQRPALAVPLYLEVLRAPRSADERRQATKGLGLAYLWTDQPDRARPLFAELVQRDPGDADASRNYARALSWSGRQRQAIEHLQAHLQRNPADEEARVQLAQSQAWLGRPDRAMQSLQQAHGADASKLRERIVRDAAPRTMLDAQRSSQSDGLRIRNARAAQSVGIDSNRGQAGIRIDRTLYDTDNSADSAQVNRPMVFGRWRFSDSVEWNAEVGREQVRPLAGPETAFTAYSTWLTVWPSDVLRLDASSSRSDFDNLRSLRLGITHRDDGVSADYTPAQWQRYTARWQRSNVSDGNSSHRFEGEAEVRWHTHPDAWVGVRHVRFAYARQSGNGYFDPLHFESTALTLRGSWRPGGDTGRWELAAYAAAGRENAVPYGGKTAYDLSLRARYQIDPNTRLEARAQRFSSRTSTPTGFARSIFGLALERSW